MSATENVQKETGGSGYACSPDKYAAFIGQIELDSIWLVSARTVNNQGPKMPPEAIVDIRGEATWAPWDGGFDAVQTFRTKFTSSEKVLAEVDVTFGLRFVSALPMTDELFAIFKEVNLPVNTWPYLREYLASTTARMNWLPLALPTLKSGVNATESRSSRPRRGRSSRKAQ